MASMYQQNSASVEAGMFPVPEVPQPVPFQPAAFPVIPPQGTVFFASPYFLPNGMPQPFFIAQPNIPLEGNVMDAMPNDYTTPMQGDAAPDMPLDAVYYPPPPLPIPFPPPFHPVQLLNPYIRPNPVYFFQQPFFAPSAPNISSMPPPVPAQTVCPKVNSASLPTNKQYQPWSTATGSAQNPLKSTPTKDNALATTNCTTFSQTTLTSGYISATETGLGQTPLRFSGNNGFRNFQRDNFDKGEQQRNKSGQPLNNYRTKLCINYKNGYCPYGERCRFIHQHISASDGAAKTFSTNAPAFVPGASGVRVEQSSPSASVEIGASNRLYSSTPVSLLGKGQGRGVDLNETPTTPTSRRVSYRYDFNAGYRRPSVADGPHLLPAF